jgi:hypothetical protein
MQFRTHWTLGAASVAIAVLLSGCGARFDLAGATMRSYADQGGRTRMNLVRYGASAWGAWEDLAQPGFGLVEGTVRGDGSVALRVYLGGSAPARFEGNLNTGETRLVGSLAATGAEPRRLDLHADWAALSGLSIRSLRASTRGALPPAATPTTYSAVGIEPGSSSAFRSWYRQRFSGGDSLVRAMENERDRFFEEFSAVPSGPLKDTILVPWSLDRRSFVVYKSKRILSIATRTAVYRGGASGRVTTRFASVDQAEPRLLSVSDFVPDDRRGELRLLLTEAARASLGLHEGESLVGSGFYQEGLEPGESFLVFGAGLVFHYDPAEAAAADLGELWILLDWKSLGPVLASGALERYGIGGG